MFFAQAQSNSTSPSTKPKKCKVILYVQTILNIIDRRKKQWLKVGITDIFIFRHAICIIHESIDIENIEGKDI